MRCLLVVGAGGHGQSVAEAVEEDGQYQCVGFADDAVPGMPQVLGLPVLGSLTDLTRLRAHAGYAIVAMGNNGIREALHVRLKAAGFVLATVVHPRAYVSASVILGAGTAVMALAVVGVDAQVGRAAIINANATLYHDAVLGDFGHLGVGVQIAGGVRVGARAWLQAGCSAGYNVVVPDAENIPAGTALRAE